MAAVSLFHSSNMAAMTSYGNTLFKFPACATMGDFEFPSAGIAEVLGSNPVEVTKTFQVSIRDNNLNFLDGAVFK